MTTYALSVVDWLYQMDFLGSKREIRTLLSQKTLKLHIPLPNNQRLPWILPDDLWWFYDDQYKMIGPATGSRKDIPDHITVIDRIPNRYYQDITGTSLEKDYWESLK